MKILNFLLFISILLLLSSCEDVIQVTLDEGLSQLTVDGWITDQAGVQSIRLTKTKSYFDNSAANPAKNATVKVTDSDGMVYDFIDSKGDGNYIWTPKNNEKIGKVGKTYTLSINFEGESYQAVSKIGRVPAIDSIGYEYQEKTTFFAKEGYRADFYTTDFKGIGDCYRIKSYRNGVYNNKIRDISIAYDAGTSEGANTDGILFILPLRRSINRPDSLYQVGETIKVELLSITEDAFYFFSEADRKSVV